MGWQCLATWAEAARSKHCTLLVKASLSCSPNLTASIYRSNRVHMMSTIAHLGTTRITLIPTSSSFLWDIRQAPRFSLRRMEAKNLTRLLQGSKLIVRHRIRGRNLQDLQSSRSILNLCEFFRFEFVVWSVWACDSVVPQSHFDRLIFLNWHRLTEIDFP